MTFSRWYMMPTCKIQSINQSLPQTSVEKRKVTSYYYHHNNFSFVFFLIYTPHFIQSHFYLFREKWRIDDSPIIFLECFWYHFAFSHFWIKQIVYCCFFFLNFSSTSSSSCCCSNNHGTTLWGIHNILLEFVDPICIHK